MQMLRTATDTASREQAVMIAVRFPIYTASAVDKYYHDDKMGAVNEVSNTLGVSVGRVYRYLSKINKDVKVEMFYV